MTAIFFLYGLAFFILGITVAIYPRKGSTFRLAKNIWLIAVFGILHGLCEWSDMFIIIYKPSEMSSLHIIRSLLLPASFICLLWFGTKSISGKKKRYRLLSAAPLFLLIIWAIIVLTSRQWFLMADIWARYLFGVPGIMLTSYALMGQSSDIKQLGSRPVMYLRLSALGFLFYSFFAGLIVPDAGFFPASLFNYSTFAETVGLEVQAFRTLCALIIAWGIVKVLGIFEQERLESLRKSRDELEMKVKERTRDLAETNTRLEREITERKIVEESLRRSEKKLKDITSSLAEGIYVLDAQGYLTFMNEEAEHLLGWTLSELINKNAHNVVHPQRADGTPLSLEDCPMYQVIKTGKKFSSRDEVFKRKDGTIFPISVLTSPIIENGRTVASVTAFRDITESKRLEAELLQADKLESIGILAGGIAHDFNNLLQAIVGNISLAKLSLNPQDVIYDKLAKAEKACSLAKDLSYRLLTFSKGGEPFKKTMFIRSFLKDAVRFSLSGSTTAARFAIADDLYPVEIDEGQMNQVVNNLIKNAQEAMIGGKVIKVSANNITVSKKDDFILGEGHYIKISIEDQGIGIPKENLSKIFDPYFSTKAMGQHKGSGLGLSISRSIIQKHGGLMTVESQIGTGTIFHIYLPASDSEVVKEKREDGHILGSGKILVMDDEERVRDISGEMLRYLNYTVEFARDGNEAIERYREAKEKGDPFDAVVLDLTIPGGMGGEGVIKKLFEIDPTVKGIVSSGYADDPVTTDYRKYGFVGAIVKPYTMEQFSRTLHEILV